MLYYLDEDDVIIVFRGQEHDDLVDEDYYIFFSIFILWILFIDFVVAWNALIWFSETL